MLARGVILANEQLDLRGRVGPHAVDERIAEQGKQNALRDYARHLGLGYVVVLELAPWVLLKELGLSKLGVLARFKPLTDLLHVVSGQFTVVERLHDLIELHKLKTLSLIEKRTNNTGLSGGQADDRMRIRKVAWLKTADFVAKRQDSLLVLND